MPLIALLFIVASALVIGHTVYTVYIVGHDDMRKARLAALKKRDKKLYEQTKRMYSQRYVRAMVLVCIGMLLYLASKLVEMSQGNGAPLELALGGLGLVVGLTGAIQSSRALKAQD